MADAKFVEADARSVCRHVSRDLHNVFADRCCVDGYLETCCKRITQNIIWNEGNCLDADDIS